MKGVVIPTLAYLVLAIVALVVLFVFFSKLVPAASEFFVDIRDKLKAFMCEQLGLLKFLTKFCW